MLDSRLNRVWLLSFADSRLAVPAARLRRQALRMGIPKDQVRILNENDLDVEFKERMRDRLVLGSRGFGYWCWKPHVCLETLKSIPDGAILCYLDIGCHLRKEGLSRFYDYLHIAEVSGFCGFQYRSFMGCSVPDPRHHYNLVKNFTKGDMLDYFNVRHDEKILNQGQLAANAFFMKKCKEAVDFCREWDNLYQAHFELMDDSPSESDNLSANCRHRHDQSALSIMWLLKGLPLLSACEIETARRHAPAPREFKHNSKWGYSYYFEMGAYPIHAKRDKGLIPLHVRVYRHLLVYYLKPFFKRLRFGHGS